MVANVSNTVGLVPGGISAMVGYRREAGGSVAPVRVLGVGTTVGAVTGGLLLLELPAKVFDAVVPVLILLAVCLMALRASPSIALRGDRTRAGVAAALATGIYGGYFGAAQGIIMLALLRLTFADDLQRLNGVKNVLVGLAGGRESVLALICRAVAVVAGTCTDRSDGS